MSEFQDFLARLQATASDEERAWLTTERLLQSLSPDLAQMAWAAAVPHWFDAEVLAALRPELKDQAETFYTQLHSLPFIEPFQGRGHNVHELTRRVMLAQLWRNCREEYITLSQRAADYFFQQAAKPLQPLTAFFQGLDKELDDAQRSEQLRTWLEEHGPLPQPDPYIQIEQIYHLLLADPEKGGDRVWEQGAAWHDEMDYTFVNLVSLSRAVHEHVDAGRVTGRAAGMGAYWEGLIALYRYQHSDAKAIFEAILSGQFDDKRLNANCISSLGDVHTRLSELAQARARYEEALPIYRAIGAKLGEANCIRSLGDVHRDLSELAQARARYEEALPIYRAIGEKIGEANCISSLGDVHTRLSELAQARARYEEALPIYRAIGAKLGEANCIRSLGDVHTRLSELAQARARYEEALPIYRAIGEKIGEANCIRSLGDVHTRLSELAQARARYEEALPIYRAIGEKIGEANCIRSLGDVHRDLSELAQARARYEEALPIYRAIGEKIGEANCISSLGDVHTRLSELAQARARYEEALPIYRAIGAKLGEANCISSLGDVHTRLSELAQARARYEEALPIYRAIGAKLGEANCIRSLGDVHTRLSELAQARARYEEALPIYRAIGAKLGEANCIRSLGDVHTRLSELAQARARYEEALPIYRAIGEKIGEANCIRSLGDVASEEKDFILARQRYEENINLCRQISSADEASGYNALGAMYEKQKDYPHAIEAYSYALVLFPDHVYIRRNRASMYLKIKDIGRAAQDIEIAAQLQPENSYLFLRQAQLANLRGEHEQALVHCAATLERYPRMNYAHFERGLAYLHLGDQAQALIAYQQGLAVTDAPSDLDDALEELQTLQDDPNHLAGVTKAIQLLQDWIVAFNQSRTP